MSKSEQSTNQRTDYRRGDGVLADSRPENDYNDGYNARIRYEREHHMRVFKHPFIQTVLALIFAGQMLEIGAFVLGLNWHHITSTIAYWWAVWGTLPS